MLSRSRRGLLVALALVALPAAGTAQQRKSAPAAARPAPAQQANPQAWMTELQQLHGQLQGLQARALQDPKLRASQQTLGTSMQAAMQKADPTLVQALNRGKELEAAARAAQAQKDTVKLRKLAMEAQQLQQRFVVAQQTAMKQPQLSAQLVSFEAALRQKMTQLDPQTPKLLSRFEELQGKLMSAMRAGPR